jgi:uncharacterized damage-inducible protein DinB
MSSPSAALVELFKHNAWANESLLDACVALRPIDLTLTVPGTYGPIRNTLVHLLAAQERFLVLLGEPPDGAPLREKEPTADMDELRSRARRSGDMLVQVVQRAGYAELVTGEWRREPYAIPTSILLTQVIHHASEHRAQIATILGAHGIAPPILDAWTYGPRELWKFR